MVIFNFYKQSAHQWRHELTLPLCTGDDGSEPAMDQFPSDVDLERDIVGTVTEDDCAIVCGLLSENCHISNNSYCMPYIEMARHA